MKQSFPLKADKGGKKIRSLPISSFGSNCVAKDTIIALICVLLLLCSVQ